MFYSLKCTYTKILGIIFRERTYFERKPFFTFSCEGRLCNFNVLFFAMRGAKILIGHRIPAGNA